MLARGSIWVAAYVAIVVSLVLIGGAVSLPEEERGAASEAGAVNALLQQVTGRPIPADFLVDYAGAVALRHGTDPYARTDELIDRTDAPAWPVLTANPHPPTVLPLVLPFSLLPYRAALAAWSTLMVFALVATLRLAGVRLLYAIVGGLALALTFPGAYGVGNVVPLIGLGIALAYRFRDRPELAGVGLALAAAPKASGIVLALPFLLTLRVRAIAWAAAFMVVLIAIPLAFYSRTWATYLDLGVEAIRRNAPRSDNASLLRLGDQHIGIPQNVTLVLIALVAIGVAGAVKDLYWPAVWFMVAGLPIAWMYSLLTLLPLALVASLRSKAASACSLVALALMVGAPPVGVWPTVIVPVVMGLALVIVALGRDDAFQLPGDLLGRLRAIWPRAGDHTGQRDAGQPSR